jgi:hypothetical protein
MAVNEEVKLQIINELTLHIEKLEMDNEIHILRDDLNEVKYETGMEYIFKLKNILGKLIENRQLNEEAIKLLETIIKDKNLLQYISM